MPSIAASLPGRDHVQSARDLLAERGVTFGFTQTGEILSNVRGGLRRGTIVGSKLEAVFGVDLETAAGLPGMSLYANGFQLNGDSGPNRNLVGGRNTVSNIEAIPTTRLSEAWIEQRFWNDSLSLRAGQLVIDTEFLVSQYFNFFASSDWPTNPKANIPSGGPAYPLSTPGLRLKYDPGSGVSWLAAVFNGDPSGPGSGEPEQRNRHGLNFRVNDAPLVITELQYRYHQDPKASERAGGIRIGAWHHFGMFDDLRFDRLGRSMADPASDGRARLRRGNDGIYAVIDRQLYRPVGGDAYSGIAAFGRAAYSPPDRSLSDLYLDAGLIFSGMIPERPADSFGASILYAHMSKQARALDIDTRLVTGVQIPLRDYELSFDFSYTATVVPGWILQPSVQLIFHPGGHIADPAAPQPTSHIGTSTVVGLRSTIRY